MTNIKTKGPENEFCADDCPFLLSTNIDTAVGGRIIWHSGIAFCVMKSTATILFCFGKTDFYLRTDECKTMDSPVHHHSCQCAECAAYGGMDEREER